MKELFYVFGFVATLIAVVAAESAIDNKENKIKEQKGQENDFCINNNNNGCCNRNVCRRGGDCHFIALFGNKGKEGQW